MSYGAVLQELRKAAGLSQSELARLAGESVDSLRNWEQGRVLPKIDAVTKIAKALGVSLDLLAFREGDGSEAQKRGPGRPPKQKPGAGPRGKKGKGK
jgi:transcriptional regulator with XRE-family HTH domain